MTVNPLPRRLADGVYWLGACYEHPRGDGELLHSYNSAYLVAGERASMLIEAGFPGDVAEVEAQVDGLLAEGLAPLKHLFVTHQETPHAAGSARFLERYPDLRLCGDTRDFHLVFPEHADRVDRLRIGDAIDLGGTRVEAVGAVIRDLESTLWAFDERSRTLFPGDGFAYGHVHADGHCGHLAEEAEDLPLPDMAAMFAAYALHWTRFQDMEPFVSALAEQIARLGVRRIASTHGLPIGDVAATAPLVYEGLRSGSAGTAEVLKDVR
ncbi:MAG TPA: MBL fold metallo-hydrolase [Baekduia sp.]|uniref:MBL fold metallo-hydrolase n=1 Tax=Baekduia sp. TaxID=2600305 RepID=UPI002D7779C9|nr:MBL fold metallo-hydrolase [Baekduia sp.]HET6509881.1 MBL fold metallo-hydrolase [Baekduia sp.]